MQTAPRLAVALLDADMEPISLAFDEDLIKEVAARLAERQLERLPAPRTSRYGVERARWMLLRQLAGLDPAAEPGDDMAAWKALVDADELPDEEDQ